jgi:hypothetical protein
MLSIKERASIMTWASGVIYSEHQYNYLSFNETDVTPAATAALLGMNSLSGISGGGVMI